MSLRGPLGALDIFVVYLPSGSDTEKRDLRLQYMETVSRLVKPKDEVLTLLMGDLNFVCQKEDRISRDSGAPSGDKDKTESDRFHKLFCNKLMDT